MLLSILFFILAGLAEIGGGYLVWLYMRDDKGPIYTVLSLPFNQKLVLVKFTPPMAVYSLPSLFSGDGLWTACDQTCMISSVVSYVL